MLSVRLSAVAYLILAGLSLLVPLFHVSQDDEGPAGQGPARRCCPVHLSVSARCTVQPLTPEHQDPPHDVMVQTACSECHSGGD